MAGNGDSHGDLQAVREDLSKLRTDLTGLVQNLMETGKSETGAAKERIVGELREALDLTSKKGKDTVETLENKIQENPLISLLVAFVIGLIFGRYLDRD